MGKQKRKKKKRRKSSGAHSWFMFFYNSPNQISNVWSLHEIFWTSSFSTARVTDIILFLDGGAGKIKETKTSIKEKGIWDIMPAS